MNGIKIYNAKARKLWHGKADNKPCIYREAKFAREA